MHSNKYVSWLKRVRMYALTHAHTVRLLLFIVIQSIIYRVLTFFTLILNSIYINNSMNCHINTFTTEKSTKSSQISSAKCNWPMSLNIIRMYMYAFPLYTHNAIFHNCCNCCYCCEHAVDKWYTVQIRDVFSNLLCVYNAFL